MNLTTYKDIVRTFKIRDLIAFEELIGKIVEAIVADHCRRLKFDLEPAHEVQLFYWKNKGYGTDIVFDLRQKPIPMEVKYKDTIDTKDLKGVLEFSEVHKPPFQMLITKEKLEMENNTILIPLWLFLLMC